MRRMTSLSDAEKEADYDPYGFYSRMVCPLMPGGPGPRGSQYDMGSVVFYFSEAIRVDPGGWSRRLGRIRPPFRHFSALVRGVCEAAMRARLLTVKVARTPEDGLSASDFLAAIKGDSCFMLNSRAGKTCTTCHGAGSRPGIEYGIFPGCTQSRHRPLILLGRVNSV